MQQTEVEAFINNASKRTMDTPSDFLIFCRECVELARRYPEQRSEIAYLIVEKGRHFGDFDVEDDDPQRQEIKDLAADLELPDEHIDISDGQDVDQKWERLSNLVDIALGRHASPPDAP